jgi:dTDP-glucose pyrophosphorylase
MIKENLKSILLNENKLIIDAINSLSTTGLLIVIVVDKSNKLLATITDGDIRKGLANGLSLKDNVSLIMNKKPKYVLANTTKIDVYNLFVKEKYKSLPVVDENQKIINCYFPDAFLSIKENPPLLIMAGGFGTRLGKLTENCPKPMLKIGNKPVLEHIIKKARDEKFTNIFIATHYKSEVIENYFGNGENFDVKITYIKEKKPLGTGGSFKFMSKFNGPIVITNGDIISKIGYKKLLDFHILNDGIATMAVLKNEIKNPYGVIRYSGIELLDFDEKPSWISYINAGIYVVESKVTKFIKENQKISMPHILKKLKDKNKRVYIFHMHEEWIDIGTPEELKKIKRSFK